MPDLAELDRFVGEHLTTAAVMVEIAAPLPARMRAFDAKRQLRRDGFDVALVEDERLRIVSRKGLEALEQQQLDLPVREFADAPRRDRLIERTLPIDDLVGKLLASGEPLLVVGDSGVTHIVTVADFAGVAGTAAALSFLLAVDRGLNQLLLKRPEATMDAVTNNQRSEAEDRHAKAEAKGAALDLVSYLSMGARFAALRKRGLDTDFELGSKDDHQRMLDARNDAAHHGLSDPYQALHAIGTAKWTLTQLAAALDTQQEEAA